MPQSISAAQETYVTHSSNQGNALEEDSRGGVPFGEDLRSNTGSLSPYDIVHMAADLDGGIQQTTELHRCTDCQAANPSGVTVC